MRTASHVLVAYAVLLVLSSVWRELPIGALHGAAPDVAALVAAYLGLTARNYIAPAVAGAVTTGYLADLLSGAPPGLHALIGGAVGLLGHGVHRRILVRGWAMTLGFSAFVGAAASFLVIVIRMLSNHPLELGFAMRELVLVAFGTAAIGPLVFWLHRRVDAAFARTHRERDAALEGITR
jgi:rod shape-determining protein MreD